MARATSGSSSRCPSPARGEPWIPPLKLERYIFLNRKLNAYFTHGEAQYFLARARQGRRPRHGQVDRAYNEYHGSRWGMFGFLEFEDDQEVLDALLAAPRGGCAIAAASGWWVR